MFGTVSPDSRGINLTADSRLANFQPAYALRGKGGGDQRWLKSLTYTGSELEYRLARLWVKCLNQEAWDPVDGLRGVADNDTPTGTRDSGSAEHPNREAAVGGICLDTLEVFGNTILLESMSIPRRARLKAIPELIRALVLSGRDLVFVAVIPMDSLTACDWYDKPPDKHLRCSSSVCNTYARADVNLNWLGVKSVRRVAVRRS